MLRGVLYASLKIDLLCDILIYKIKRMEENIRPIEHFNYNKDLEENTGSGMFIFMIVVLIIIFYGHFFVEEIK